MLRSGARSATPATRKLLRLCLITCCAVQSHVVMPRATILKVQTYVTSKITTSIDVELEYLEVEYIARRWLLANLAFPECSAWTYGLNKLSDCGAGT